MNESPVLRDASVQEIQLELIRRTEYNAFYGDRVYANLLRHRDRWIAVLLDRERLPDYTRLGRLLMMGLMKLRDLSDNVGNADTLFILTESHEEARESGRVIEEEDWGGEVRVYTDAGEIATAVATSEEFGLLSEEFGLLSVWWD